MITRFFYNGLPTPILFIAMAIVQLLAFSIFV